MVASAIVANGGVLQRPPSSVPVCAALVLGGSSSRVEEERVRLLADHGAIAASMRWFGGPGQPPGICEVPLEEFVAVIDELSAFEVPLALIGVSKGAEAALLLAAADPRVRFVAAFSPSSVVWANVGPGRDGRSFPYRSSWTWRGEALPFVPYDDRWKVPPGDPPAYRSLYEQSLRTGAGRVAAATIPVESIRGQVLVTAGGDDQLWPSDRFAREIAVRRADHGLGTEVIIEPAAGHRLILPGEAPPAPRVDLAHGGTPEADTGLGARAWDALQRELGLG